MAAATPASTADRPARTVTVVVNPRASTGASTQLWQTTTELLSRCAAGYRELHTHGDGQDPERIIAAYRQVVDEGVGALKTPPLWDGRAAERIVEVLVEAL